MNHALGMEVKKHNFCCTQFGNEKRDKTSNTNIFCTVMGFDLICNMFHFDLLKFKVLKFLDL